MKPIKKEPEISEDSKLVYNKLKNINETLLVDFKSEFDISNKNGIKS